MGYILKKVTEDAVDFTADSMNLLVPRIFFLVGLLGLTYAGYDAWDGYVDEGLEPIQFLIAGAAGMFLAFSGLASRETRDQLKQLRFDNKKAQLILSLDENFKHTAVIPYQQLKEFKFRWKGSSSTSDNQGRFVVLLVLKDMQVWYLDEFTTQAKAEAHVEYLRKMVELSKVGEVVVPAAPASVRVERVGSSAVLWWRNDLRIGFAYAGLMFASACVIIFALTGLDDVSMNLIRWIGGVVAGLLLLVILLMVSRWNEQCRVEIGNGKLNYSRMRNGKLKSIRDIPVAQIRSVGVNYENQSGGSGLIIADESVVNIYREMEGGKLGISDLFRVIRTMGKAFTIPAGGLNMVDRVRLSEMLQMLIQANGGKEIL